MTVTVFPAAFEQRERALLGARYDELFAWPTPVPARGLTVNGLRCGPAGPAGPLAETGLPLTPSPFCPWAFTLADPALRLGRHPYHHAGVFYLQEPSASAPAALLDVRPGHRVADLCAAPGGKSSQLAGALAGQGILVSNEYDAARAEVLRQNLERMGVTNAVVLNEDTARLAAAFPGWFDRVLVDAPCSGEGMFRKEPAAVAQYAPALVEHCAVLGRQILDNAAALLAPGGVLVYSTCTFAPQEDEAQVAAFLQRHPDFTLDDLSGAGFGRPGEANRGPAGFEASRCRRIWPADGGEGHFMARLRRSPDAVATEPPSKPGKKGRAERRAAPSKALAPWAQFAQGLFPGLATCPATLAGDRVFLTPGMALPAHGLRVVRAGVPAGRLLKNRFEPDHALFMAWGALCTNREELSLGDPRTAAWLRGEEIDARTAKPGWCAVCVDGFPLGGGKTSGGRVKNHYPKGLRNLG